ncbi:MAG TPA: hypothetical protein VGC36_06900 [Rhizomicrobium sp.]
MHRFISAALAMTLFVAAAAPPAAERDRQRILNQLHIKTLRPGVSSDPAAPNAANYDEAKANPYPRLPDPLRLKDGRLVASRDMWWQQRRQEITDDIEREIYGQLQASAPILNWTVADTRSERVGVIATTRRYLVAHASAGAIGIDARMIVTLPAKATGPVPLILLLTDGNAKWRQPSTWREQVLAKGWGAAVLDVTSVQPDSSAGLTRGVIGLVAGGKPRGQYDWGVLRAWAWGASRAMDYFEGDPAIDPVHIGIAGHSRYGKAALIAMAYDPRYSIAYISSSGAGGAALLRRNFGERIENLAGVAEYHRFGPRFLTYAGPKTANDLPVDAHELIALAAPRPIFFGAGANGDNWADPQGMFMAAAAAGPVYELLGKKGLGAAMLPPVGKPLTTGELAFALHREGHTMEPNWPSFLRYAQRYFKPPPKKGK